MQNSVSDTAQILVQMLTEIDKSTSQCSMNMADCFPNILNEAHLWITVCHNKDNPRLIEIWLRAYPKIVSYPESFSLVMGLEHTWKLNSEDLQD